MEIRGTTGSISSLRKRIHVVVAPEAYTGAGLSAFNVFIIILIVCAIITAIVETEPAVRDGHETIFLSINVAFGFLFSAEYAIRIWTAGINPKYKGISGLFRYITTFTTLIDLMVLIPFWLSFGASNAAILRLARLLRLFSLAKMGRFSNALTNIARALATRGPELGISVAMAVGVILIAASVLYLTEGKVDPEHFGSIPRALWWGVATVTKVGYGGAFPVTLLGKFAAAIFAFGAVGVVAVPTGILAASFSSAFRSQDEETD